MKLSLEQIQAVTFGAARTKMDEEGRVRFFRFTEAQEKAYQVYNDTSYQKSFSTAGVRLEFETESRHLGLSVEALSGGSSRTFFVFSIFCNGEKLAALGNVTNSSDTISGYYTLPEGNNHLCIYFPWARCGTLRALELDDGASIQPVKKSCKMLIFGDSITHGYDASEPQLSYATLMTDALDAAAINKAIGGEVFFPTLATLKDDFSPDYITVAYGTNDWSHSPKETFEQNSIAFYRNLSESYPNAKIFMLSPIWRRDQDRITDVGEFNRVEAHFASIAESIPNVTLISGYDLVPHDSVYFSDEYLHPNDAGFSYYAENLLKKLQEHLD